MRQTLQSRLATLEAMPRPEPAQEAPTSDDVQRWAYNAFYRNELRIVGSVVEVNHRTARPNEHAALTGIARVINEWRANNGNEPFLPIMPDDAKSALSLLRSGHLQISKDGQRVGQNYKFSWEYNHKYAGIGDTLTGALKTFIASGGGDGQPYQPGEVEELLSAFVEHAEGNE